MIALAHSNASFMRGLHPSGQSKQVGEAIQQWGELLTTMWLLDRNSYKKQRILSLGAPTVACSYSFGGCERFELNNLYELSSSERKKTAGRLLQRISTEALQEP